LSRFDGFCRDEPVFTDGYCRAGFFEKERDQPLIVWTVFRKEDL